MTCSVRIRWLGASPDFYLPTDAVEPRQHEIFCGGRAVNQFHALQAAAHSASDRTWQFLALHLKRLARCC
ncbi:hypothetical protein SAMCFNEI73_Ch2381 [Sinorhizobium americanum]|uniref:Uncharacterized protein n=1 Tax=Sinorhizobium americanum TaxID=194963 RepID=A0A1L3LNI2_9HYPH|nr:hypothetical protein SAMCFNEI73_Ch2381 [Sinorhizobium americanum]